MCEKRTGTIHLSMQSIPNADAADEIEIDLGKYFAMLLAQWRTLLAFTLIGALLGTAVAVIFPAPYEASASVAIVKTRTDVQFDQRIRTLSPDNTRIAFNRTESAGYFTVAYSLLMVMQADGSDKQPVTADASP